MIPINAHCRLLTVYKQNGREFDIYDIVANCAGSGIAVLACTWYHKRMLERKRAKKYTAVPGDDEELDLELGGGEDDAQETGVARPPPPQQRSLEQEVDNWDENAEDWDADEQEANAPDATGGAAEEPASAVAADEPKKRED